MQLGQSRTPEGTRLYAIGDVHGCDVQLAGVHDAIAADLEERPPADYRIIHVGDYVDRGPDSRAVVERLWRLGQTDGRVICLRGNHDVLMGGFLGEPDAFGGIWLDNGGAATLRSYGVTPTRSLLGWNYERLAMQLAVAMPPAHRGFIESLPLSARLGDYFFVHAGIRPGVSLEAQDPEDLIWIREDFLLSNADHGVVVVHGHTPANAPEIRANRIGIDTGAVFGGPLTCVVLDGTEVRFL
jgi:serine/threonine protein phosphatase 1